MSLKEILDRGPDLTESKSFGRGERVYRWVTSTLSRAVRRRVLGEHPDWNWQQGIARFMPVSTQFDAPRPSPEKVSNKLIWFHAASAGELEMLWSVARKIRADRKFDDFEIGLSVFSPSARMRLQAFHDEFKPVYCWASPWEGEWFSFFRILLEKRKLKLSMMVTAKYECWPEMWGSLARLKVPLLLVNSELRRSLRWGARICSFVFRQLPELFFSTVESDSRDRLDQWLGKETGLGSRVATDRSDDCVRVMGDPRWDQVTHRMMQRSPRTLQVLESLQGKNLPRPWCIAGSVWGEDFAWLMEAVRSADFSGTLWLVPHKISTEEVLEWDLGLRRNGFGFVLKTKDLRADDGVEDLCSVAFEKGRLENLRSDVRQGPCADQRAAVLVNEMGLLAELYSRADLAYVGGGLRTGLHSVIEPAVSNIPIVAGSFRSSGFPEVRLLVEQGQLTLVKRADELAAWLRQNLERRPSEAEMSRWSQWRNLGQVNASARIADWVQKIVSADASV